MSDGTKPWRVKLKHGDPWIVTANNVLIASCISQHIANQIVAMANGDIRSAALEEAARVADEIDRTYEHHVLRWGVQRCAERIRSLKDKQPDTRTPTEGESL